MPVSTARPRIWITPATLPQLKAKAVATNDRWTPVLAAANVNPADWNSGIVNYSLAYLMTGNNDYAARAWSLMSQSMASGLAQISPDDYYQCRNYFIAAPIVYDWLHDWMSAAQRAQLQADLENCAAAVWPETNPARQAGWAVTNPLNNYYHGFMLTWLAGLSLFGDSPKAQGIIDLARGKWGAAVAPMLSGTGQGGYMIEGTAYGSASAMEVLQYTLAVQSATGEDLIAANPWFTDLVSTMISLTNPPMTEMAPFGDLASGPINDTHRRVMLMMAGHDPRCANWLASATPNRCTQRINAWCEWLWYPG